jgi:hypothetical protein
VFSMLRTVISVIVLHVGHVIDSAITSLQTARGQPSRQGHYIVGVFRIACRFGCVVVLSASHEAQDASHSVYDSPIATSPQAGTGTQRTNIEGSSCAPPLRAGHGLHRGGQWLRLELRPLWH